MNQNMKLHSNARRENFRAILLTQTNKPQGKT